MKERRGREGQSSVIEMLRLGYSPVSMLLPQTTCSATIDLRPTLDSATKDLRPTLITASSKAEPNVQVRVSSEFIGTSQVIRFDVP